LMARGVLFQTLPLKKLLSLLKYDVAWTSLS